MLTKVNYKTEIGDILRYPQLVGVLQEAGLQLTGCSLDLSISIKRFFKSQGLSNTLLDESLVKINNLVEKIFESNGGEINGEVVITETAAEKISSFLKAKGKDLESTGLRITVVPGGCSGYQYYLKVDESRGEWDLVFDKNGAKVIVAKADVHVLKDAILDYQELSLNGGGGFMIDNPNAQSTCSCGRSFG